jgi:hypothetical protein
MIDKERLLRTANMVVAWAEARNLIKGSDPKSQTLKTVSEFGELAQAIINEDRDLIVDGIGDTLVTQIIVSAQLGVDFGLCLQVANMMGETPSGSAQKNSLCCASVLGCMADNVLKGQVGTFQTNLSAFLHFLQNICDLYALEMAACLEYAYDEIKDRLGVMYNGAFIKSDDPAYAGAVAALGLEG